MEDDFLDLGGHSLLAARILARTRETFGIDITPDVLFDCSTVAALAVAVVERLAVQVDAAGMVAALEDLSDDEARRLLEEGERGTV